MSGSILCAVDISNPKSDADTLKTAAKMAALEDAQLDVVTVVPDYGLSLVSSFFEEDHHKKLESEARNHLHEFVEGVLGSDIGAKVRHVVLTGKAYEMVLKTAEESGASLIVVGAHKADFKDYLLGPNAARIVRHSDCSVYVVR